MTITEFNATSWGANMIAEYDGALYCVAGVNFVEMLVSLNETAGADEFWVRCENTTLIDGPKP